MDHTTGYFFGTFNPIHMGHLVFATCALEQFNLDRILFIPAAEPPHRTADTDMAPFSHRVNMVRLACQAYPRFGVSNIESLREGPSYTVDTLRQLVPGFETMTTAVPVLIGRDALAQLATWRETDTLINRCLFFQAPRSGEPPVTSVHLNGQTIPLRTKTVAMPEIGISASLIRQRMREGQTVRTLTPDAVCDYIAWNRLYRS